MKKKSKRKSFAEKYGVNDIFLRRLVFTVFMLPAVANLFLFSLFIDEGRGFVLGCGAALAIYFVITLLFEIKTERWTVFTLIAVATLSILVSLFFIMAYKLYLFLIVFAIELIIAIALILMNDKLPRPSEKGEGKNDGDSIL